MYLTLLIIIAVLIVIADIAFAVRMAHDEYQLLKDTEDFNRWKDKKKDKKTNSRKV